MIQCQPIFANSQKKVDFNAIFWYTSGNSILFTEQPYVFREVFVSELSTRLHLRRKELGLSQEELAQRMGYRSKSSITKLEKGINDLPQSKVEELAAALETTPAYLLGLDAPVRRRALSRCLP